MSSQATTVTIGDGTDWQFINGGWADGPDGQLAVDPKMLNTDGDYMQGVHYAINRKLCYQDCTVKLDFSLSGHTDVGVVLRARDESHFYLVHFPNCGQASRAQHFWVALSKMDESGYLRRIKMQMIPRVSSTSNTPLSAEVSIHGSRITVSVGDYGHFEAEDSTFAGPGQVGLYLFARATLKNVSIEGTPVTHAPVWREDVRQPVNWYHPLPNDTKQWQQSLDIKRFDDGELLMLVNIQANKVSDMTARAVPHLTRSTDGGLTWSEPALLDIGEVTSSWSAARIHITPKGRLIGFVPGTDHKLVSESTDRGQTWKPIGKTNLHIGPPRAEPVQDISPQGLMNLKDGGMLVFHLFGPDIHDDRYELYTWGSKHCQGFSRRSDDDGATWSEAVNIDTPGVDADGKPLDGNLDFTEVSAVELANGRIMGFVRPIYSPTMWEIQSDDGGRSWAPAVRGPFPGYAAPNMVRTACGALLIAHRAPNLTVHCSLDDGLNWDQGTMIDSGLWAMGSMVEVEPDVVLYVYWDTYATLVRGQRFRVGAAGLDPVRS
jgi:hypothetical protein